MNKITVSLSLIFFLSTFTFAQLDSVYTLTGEIYVGKVEQSDNYITIILKSNAKIFLEKKYIQNIVYSSPVNIEPKNEFLNPDGENVSFHFTPFFSDGRLSVKNGNTTLSYDYENTTNIEVSIKIPTSNFTFEPFYRSSTMEIKSENDYSEKFNGNIWGCKISYYIK
jgi:sRNA-binding regulator protein Hfq